MQYTKTRHFERKISEVFLGRDIVRPEEKFVTFSFWPSSFIPPLLWPSITWFPCTKLRHLTKGTVHRWWWTCVCVTAAVSVWATVTATAMSRQWSLQSRRQVSTSVIVVFDTGSVSVASLLCLFIAAVLDQCQMSLCIPPHAGSGVVRIDPLRFLARHRKKWLNQALYVLYLSVFLLCCLLRPLLCIASLSWYVFCLLVVLVKLSVLAKWLDRKTRLRKPKWNHKQSSA